VRLVLLALLDGHVRLVEILVALEPLYRLPREIAVGHRVPKHGDALARIAQKRGHVSGRLALTGPGPDGADRDDGL
jgi:hypothetical protein